MTFIIAFFLGLLLINAFAFSFQNVPLVNITKLFSNLRIVSITSDIFNIFVEGVIYNSTSQTGLINKPLEKVLVVKPLRVDVEALEKVKAIYNATQLVNVTTEGTISIINQENYSGKYGFNLFLENINYTTLPKPSIYIPELLSGKNLIANYSINKLPRLKLGLKWETSFDEKARYFWNESIRFKVLLNNTSPDELNLSLKIPVPEDLIKRVQLIDAESLTPGLAYDKVRKEFEWRGIFGAYESRELDFKLTLNFTDPNFVVDKWVGFDFKATANYEVNGTLSGLGIKDLSGNEFYLVSIKSKKHRTIANIELIQPMRFEVLTRLVLAWVTDEANEWFSETLAKREDAFFTLVRNSTQFFSELNQHFYNLIFLLNTEWEEGLSYAQAEAMEKLIYQGSPVGRELVLTGYALKSFPELGEILGVKYRGSLPMGKRFEFRQVYITQNHSLTYGYVDKVLNSTSWAVRTIPTFSKPLAYFQDIMPGKALGKPQWMVELPAITVAIYGKGSSILFAADIGTSAYRNVSSQEWLELANRSIDLVFEKLLEPSVELEIRKDVLPKVLTVKHAGELVKRARINIRLTNVGQADLLNLTVTEQIPQLSIPQISWREEKLKVGESVTLGYSLWVPVGYVGSYELITDVVAYDLDGKRYEFNKTAELEVRAPPRPAKPPVRGRFEITPSEWTLTLAQNQSAAQSFEIKNVGDGDLTNIKITSIGQIAGWISFSDETIERITPGGSKTITATIAIPSQTRQKLYRGKIVFSDGIGVEKFMVDVEVEVIK